ncbi:bzip transcription factor protein [Stemphylium lycopersici]|uniref:Bzip transcription factor protein n=1 Tax=Stemphylium lycopersici TaxID=183478 RepID=A0A364N6R6_STELY|nr:bzip transcription factor protein [Stemphylium lycopersici]RAR12950.1 bzip transcription factor protein [Stemphylium lycopersici]
MASPGEADTPEGAPRDDASGDGQPSKKRKTGPTSRGVANLTPEQLARKRANDREAQRAIRERTKNQIDRLNQRIRDLESQQPYNDLQIVLREKEAVQAENTDIKKRLESVLSIIQPIVRATGGLNELAAAAERSPLPVHPHPHPHPHQQQRDAPVQPTDPRHFSVAASPQNGVHSPTLGEGGGRSWLYPSDAPTSHLRRYSNESPSSPFEQSRTPLIQTDMPFDERLGVDFLLDNGQRRPVDPNLPPPQQPRPSNVSSSQHAMYAPHMVAHLTLPRNLPATCPLDVILLDFLQDRQNRAAEGVPMKTLVGPHYPNFTSLAYPDRVVESHPLSKLFTDILRTFPDICAKPEQVAIVFIMFLIMRWQIEPTQENYDRLPHWATPRPSQLFTAHALPRLRDKIIASQPPVSFENFFIPFTTTISLNWPYEHRDCLLPASAVRTSTLSTTSSVTASSPFSTHVNAGSPQGPATPQPPSTNVPGTMPTIGPLPKEEDQWLINPAFETHLRDLNNWTLGPSFRGTFPVFADAVKIKEGSIHQSFNSLILSNMATALSDPVHQQIFSHLLPRRASFPVHIIETISGNITFLIKYTAGFKVLPSQVSISVFDVRGADNKPVGHKAAVCIHGAPGKFKVVVSKEVKWGENVVAALSEKVDVVIREILEKEGNEGYGDF